MHYRRKRNDKKYVGKRCYFIVEWIVELINTTVFPVAMCIILSYYVKYTNDKDTEKIEKITEALNNNTVVLTKLCEKMDGKE